VSTFISNVSHRYSDRYRVQFFPFTNDEAIVLARKNAHLTMEARGLKPTKSELIKNGDARLNAEHILFFHLQVKPGSGVHKQMTLWKPKSLQKIQGMFRSDPRSLPPDQNPAVKMMLAKAFGLSQTDIDTLMAESAEKYPPIECPSLRCTAHSPVLTVASVAEAPAAANAAAAAGAGAGAAASTSAKPTA
jgi:hypothetical protein